MLECSCSILIKHSSGSSNLHVYNGQIMTEAIVYFARQPVALFSRSEFFYLSRMITQQLICFCERFTSIAFPGRDSSEDHHEYYARAIDDGERDRVDPTAAQ